MAGEDILGQLLDDELESVGMVAVGRLSASPPQDLSLTPRRRSRGAPGTPGSFSLKPSVIVLQKLSLSERTSPPSSAR